MHLIEKKYWYDWFINEERFGLVITML